MKVDKLLKFMAFMVCFLLFNSTFQKLNHVNYINLFANTAWIGGFEKLLF